MDKYIVDFSAFRSINDIINDLKKPVAIKHIEWLEKGKTPIPFISWSNAVKYLDYYAFGWFYEIVRESEIAGKLILTVRLTIPAKEGLFWREATGNEESSKDGYGDLSTNAEAQALKRAAAKFGLMLYAYDLNPNDIRQLKAGNNIEIKTPLPITPTNTGQRKVEPEKDVQTANTGQIESIEEAPKAQDIPIRIQKAQAAITALGYTPFKRMDNVTDEQYFDRLTSQYKKCKESPKTTPEVEKKEKIKYLTQIQNSAITNLCDTFGIDADEECQSFLGKQVIELSVEEADQFIEYLQSQVEDEPGEFQSVTINQDESITRAQLETISLMMKKVKGKSMIDFVQEYTDGRAEVFEDMSQTEAGKLIHDLSAQLNDQAKAAKTKK